MKMTKTHFINYLFFSLSLLLFIFNGIACDLLVRSPNELKSQFISMSLFQLVF